MASDAQNKFIIDAILGLDDDIAVKVITDTLTLRPEVAPVVVNKTCPALTYAPASSMTSRRSAGIVKNLAGANGFGMLACPEIKLIFGSDVHVHKDQLGDMAPGTEVNFAVLLSKDNKPQAFDLQPGHEGASQPSPVNASHLAAAKLLAPKTDGKGEGGGFKGGGMDDFMMKGGKGGFGDDYGPAGKNGKGGGFDPMAFMGGMTL